MIYRSLGRPQIKGKFGAKRTEFSGRSFASKLEASVYALLLDREKSGEIRNIECQVQVALSGAGIIYRPDFRFETNSGPVYAEAKGFETPEWRLKLRLWRAYGPGYLEIWKGTAMKPVLVEIISKGSFA